MKKILILFLLLLNLHVITGHGDLSVGFGTISAQTMLEEQLQEVVVTGSLYVDCDWCRGSVARADLEFHKQYDCPERTIICEFCHMSYKAYEGHYCNGTGGSGGGTGGDSGGGIGGGSGGGTGGGTGGGSGGGASHSSNNFKEYTVKNEDLVLDKILDREYEPQDTIKDCVPTAMEYVAQYIENSNRRFREDFEYDYKYYVRYGSVIHEEGVIPIKPFINYEFNNTEVPSYICFNYYLKDNNYPILTTIPDNPETMWGENMHEIVIIGYTKEGWHNYIYIDPLDGKTKTISYDKLLGPHFVIKSLKKH